jgi:hypothetical protein
LTIHLNVEWLGGVKMRANKAKGSITISTSVSPELWTKAQEHGISWAEALRVGLSFILSKIGSKEYQNPLNYERKIESLALKLQEFAQEKEALENELKNIRTTQK